MPGLGLAAGSLLDFEIAAPKPKKRLAVLGRVRFFGFGASLISLETKPSSVDLLLLDLLRRHILPGPLLFVPGPLPQNDGECQSVPGAACGAGGINTGFAPSQDPQSHSIQV